MWMIIMIHCENWMCVICCGSTRVWFHLSNDLQWMLLCLASFFAPRILGSLWRCKWIMNQWIVYADRWWATWGWHLTRDEVQPSRYLHPWSLRDFDWYLFVCSIALFCCVCCPRFVRPNIGLRKRSRFYCITSSFILVSVTEYVLILLHHTSKYPPNWPPQVLLKCHFHQCTHLFILLCDTLSQQI